MICCTLCGNPIDYTPGKRGRPPEYHKDCRRIYNMLPWLEDLFEGLTMTEPKKKQLRSRLWSLANQLNNK